MIIPKVSRLEPDQLDEIESIVGSFGCRILEIVGAQRCVYAILGDERHEVMINRLLGLDYVDRVEQIDSPYKLMDRRSGLASESLVVAGVRLGQEPLFIAGPCTLDPKNPHLTYESAAAIREAGAHVLRGGVWKPRTMPYSYQGEDRAMDVLIEARQRTGLPVMTEVMTPEQVRLALDAKVDILQIGARNALNYPLLRSIGEATRSTRTPVLLKRSRAMAPAEEFIAAAEYIAAAGNPNIILCPRGTLPALDAYRNYPDESLIPLLKERTWAPVLYDPSHAVGRALYVPQAALAAIAYGADGLCIECHCAPQKGIGDDPKQAITPDTLRSLLESARTLRAALAPIRTAH